MLDTHCWVGRGSLFSWPPRCPDLNVLDFYLWGRTQDNMIEQIENAIHSISRAEIEAAVSSSRARINSCILQNGGHFEHL